MIRAARNRQDGISLIEVLFATAILGLAVVSIVSGFGATIRSGVLYRKEAKIETVLRSASEAVVAQGFKNCTGSSLPTYPVSTPVDGHTVSITNVAYWNGSNPAGFSTACSNQSNGLIRVTVRVVSPPPQSVTEDLAVYIRSAA